MLPLMDIFLLFINGNYDRICPKPLINYSNHFSKKKKKNLLIIAASLNMSCLTLTYLSILQPAKLTP